MNKKQFIERMVEHTDSPKGEARKHLQAFTTTVSEALQGGEEVQLPGFGKFYVREQKAREGKNPQTGETMQIGARKVPAFKAGKALKESVEYQRKLAGGIDRILRFEFPAPPTKVCPPECVEEEFCELRLYGVLRSSQTTNSRKS